MLAVIGVLLIIWLGITVLGAVVHFLLPLAIIGGLLFLGTAAYGAIKGKNNKQLRR